MVTENDRQPIDRSVAQIRTARQMDPAGQLAIPVGYRIGGRDLCQLDAHVPIKALSEELDPGFAEPDAIVV